MNIKKTVFKLFSGGLILSVLEFGGIAIFTRIAGASAIGSFFVFQAVTGMISIPSDLGVSRTAEKQLSSKEPVGEVISTALSVKLLLLLPWLFGLFVASSFVNEYVGVAGITPFVAAGLITAQGRRLSIRILAGQLRVGQTPLLRIIGKTVWVGLGVALVHLGWGPLGIITAFIIGDVAIAVGALTRMKRMISWPTRDRARGMIGFGRYIFIGSVGGYVYSWMDVAILRFFVPTSLIGAYEIAWRIASLSMILTTAIKDTLFAQVSEWYSDQKFEEIKDGFERWLQPTLYLTIPAFAGAIVLGKDILQTIFGAQVVLAYPVLVIFMLERIVRSIHMLLGPSLFAMEKPKLGYRGSIVAIILNLFFNITLIPMFGLIGAAVATTVGSAASAIVNIIYVRRFVPVQFPWSRIVWSSGCAATMALVLYFLLPYFPITWIGVALGIISGFIIYSMLLFANTDIRLETKMILHSIYD